MDRYAFLMLSMSLDEAKAVLGFPPSATPSEDEVRRAQRRMALENHPDRGGDAAKMQEVNAAADILLGKARPTYDRRPGGDGGYAPGRYTDYGHTTRPPDPPPKPVITTFEEAAAKAGVPSDVEWLFVTGPQKGTNYTSDEFSRFESFWVAYGRTASKHVFVGMHHLNKSEYFVGGSAQYDVWAMKTYDHPIRETVQPAWLHGNVAQALKGVGFTGRFNSRVVDARGWRFNPRMPKGNPVPIKQFLIETGAVAGDDPSVATRKHVVELTYYQTWKETDHTYAWPGARDAQGIKLTVNGRDYYLSKTDTKTLVTKRLGGKLLLDLVFKGYFYHESKKTLTRLREAKPLLAWMAENLTDLPESVRETFAAISRQ